MAFRFQEFREGGGNSRKWPLQVGYRFPGSPGVSRSPRYLAVPTEIGFLGVEGVGSQSAISGGTDRDQFLGAEGVGSQSTISGGTNRDRF